MDGDTEALSRHGTFMGQHVYTSKPGVAVQINAFNFPVWGMLEKLAPALLACNGDILFNRSMFQTDGGKQDFPRGQYATDCWSPGGFV